MGRRRRNEDDPETWGTPQGGESLLDQNPDPDEDDIREGRHDDGYYY